MFSKNNSKALTIVNVFLLGQLVISILATLYALAEILFPSGSGLELRSTILQCIVIGVLAGLGLTLLNGIPNGGLRKLFDVSLVKEEKVFNLIAFLIIDVTICYVALELIQGNRSVALSNSVSEEIINGLSLAAVFSLLLGLGRKIRIFRTEFSKTLNAINAVTLLCLGWNLAWFIAALIKGPEDCGLSGRIMTVTMCNLDYYNTMFARQIFYFMTANIVFVILLIVLTKNGEKLSGGEVKTKKEKVIETPVKEEAKTDTTEEQLRAMQEELTRLKEELAKKNND